MNSNDLTTLTDLACQLGSPHDRHRYTKIILLSKQLQDHINELKSTIENNNKVKDEEDEDLYIPSPTMISSTTSTTSSTTSSSSSSSSPILSSSFRLSHSYSYQPQLNQSSTITFKQIDRLSKQYVNIMNPFLTPTNIISSNSIPSNNNNNNNNNNNKSLTISTSLNLSSSSSSSTKIEKNKIIQQNHQYGLLSPPLSPPSSSSHFPPRTTSLISNSLVSNNHNHNNHKRLSKVNPDPHSLKKEKNNTTILPPISPPSSPKVETNTNKSFQCPTITPIQKNNGMKLRSFFGQSILLNKMVRMEQRQDDMDTRFYLGKNEFTNQLLKILKVNIMYGHHDTCHPLAPFGIYFINAASTSSSSHNHHHHQNDNNNNNNNHIPDSLITDALLVWLEESNLPHLSSASHVLKDGVKLYIVYDDKI